MSPLCSNNVALPVKVWLRLQDIRGSRQHEPVRKRTSRPSFHAAVLSLGLWRRDLRPWRRALPRLCVPARERCCLHDLREQIERIPAFRPVPVSVAGFHRNYLHVWSGEASLFRLGPHRRLG